MGGCPAESGKHLLDGRKGQFYEGAGAVRRLLTGGFDLHDGKGRARRRHSEEVLVALWQRTFLRTGRSQARVRAEEWTVCRPDEGEARRRVGSEATLTGR